MERNRLISYLDHFFPDAGYTNDNFDTYLEHDELDTHQGSISNILKAALVDDIILEVQLSDMKEIYHCRLLDKYKEIKTSKRREKKTSKKVQYLKGDYFGTFNEVIITPLEPPHGNFFIQKKTETNNLMLLRVVDRVNAVELASFFKRRILIEDIPALQLTYPFIARRVSNIREHRAKVPSSMKFKVVVTRYSHKPFSTIPINICSNGIALIDPMGEDSNLLVGEKLQLELQIPRVLNLVIDGTIIHQTRLRDRSGFQHIFGVQFMFTPLNRSKVEEALAATMRAHARERLKLSDEYGLIFDEW